jgi:hypothetical protein
MLARRYVSRLHYQATILLSSHEATVGYARTPSRPIPGTPHNDAKLPPRAGPSTGNRRTQIPPTPKPVVLRIIPPAMGLPATPRADTVPNPADPTSITKVSATSTYPMLKTLCDKVENLPNTVLIADDLSPLAGFSGDPVLLTNEVPDDEMWEVWDPHLNRLIPQSISDIFPLVMRGDLGLIRLIVFFDHIVYERKVDPGLLDGKIGRILQAIDSCVSTIYTRSIN